MSRFIPDRTSAPIYEAAAIWREKGLLQEKSLLAAASNLWTSDNFDDLDRFFVRNLDEGQGNFLEKLQSQLKAARPGAKQLMAELLWVTLLFPSNIGSRAKRETILEIWSWAGSALSADDPLLSDATLGGLGSAGTAYLTQRWRELVFFIIVLRNLKALPAERIETLLTDGWAFIEWLSAQHGAANRQLTHILPHLLFPDLFERISSLGDKQDIVAAFTSEPKSVWRKRPIPEVDRALLDLRNQLEAEEGGPIDFYSPQIKAKWRPTAVPGPVGFAETFSAFLNAYGSQRSSPFSLGGDLSHAMRQLQSWLQKFQPIASRPTLRVKVSVGQGEWTKTPWVALLDERLTNSTQRGIYVVFLIAEDLSISYLTLNQGMTDLGAEHGQRGAVQEMLRVAEETRPRVASLLEAEYILDNQIDLRSDTTAARNYEVGTIAHVALPTDALPDDAVLEGHLENLLRAYDRFIESSETGPLPVVEKPPASTFTLDDALAELFLDRAELEQMLEIWEAKKNIILQGAPGVGKSFIARRLAYSLLGSKATERVQSVQFHQSYGYEDFVRGYRPSGSQGFELKDGVFFEFCQLAKGDAANRYVLIIDEINRGNLSKILGELMLLIEPDKRGSDWAMRLAYCEPEEPAFYVPESLFILGMMNTADRSLSVVDYALRRRFAFISMHPLFGSPKYRAHLSASGVPKEVVDRIVARMGELNAEVEGDRLNLGPGFRIGHSFFTPQEPVSDPVRWYKRVVQTEIFPLLEEYWFDDPEKAEQWRGRLLADQP